MAPLSKDFELEALVARVEQGEPLDDTQLARLERAAAEHEPALDWLLCYAHALLNSDRPRPAAALLDRVISRAPDVPLARLAKARALGAMERWDEAEAELRRVLARRPRHADALRALALLRLRAGAPRDAARLAQQVLEADPRDDASRQILAEAEAASSPDAAAATVDPFAQGLRRTLIERGIKTRLDPQRGLLLVELQPGRLGRLSLESLRESARADPRGQGAFAESLVDSLTRLAPPAALPPLEEVRARVFPALRPASFPEKAGPVLSAPGPAGLLWVYALDHPGFVTFLPPEAPGRWGLTLDEIARLALDNLDRHPLAPSRYRAVEGRLSESEHGWDVLAFDEGDGYDAARLLAPRHRGLLDSLHPGPWTVVLPTSGYALLAREDDLSATAVIRSAAQAEGGGPDGLSTRLFRLSERLEAGPE
ncbi:MAG: tetratricopeptide repeat protein [Deltaproteobacteria bacterium]|nr:tetratricopeptide repeat protein [Deltaproteobacteria bacterium]